MSDAIYEGLRVLDLSTNIAGPICAMLLGDLGADVVKIERPPIGDDTRALPPKHSSGATVFSTFNRNKRSVVLDIKSDSGRAALLRLVKDADVLVESFPPGLAAKLQLRYEDLQQHNPALVVCSVSAFGNGELGSKMPGYDALVQSVSGMMSFTGLPDTPPVRIAPSILDISTGMWGATNVMAALKWRELNNGAGKHVNVALIDSAFAMMSHQVSGMLATDEHPELLGSGAPSAAPYRVYASSDKGAFMLATASEPQYVRLCGVIGLPQLADDPRFKTMADRLKHRSELDQILEQVFSTWTLAECLERLSGAGISVGKVNRLDEALDLAVVKERDLFFSPEALDWAEGIPLLKTPLNQNYRVNMRRPPSLGEHTEEVLLAAGMTRADISSLKR